MIMSFFFLYCLLGTATNKNYNARSYGSLQAENVLNFIAKTATL
jgi:hypothetical protein